MQGVAQSSLFFIRNMIFTFSQEVPFMRLLIIRHADPDYSIDSLTATGKIEAELLSRRIAPLRDAYFYVSPMGRARDTAAPSLKLAERTAVECDWLREFSPGFPHPGKDSGHCAWDWLPDAWTAEPEYFDHLNWARTPIMKEAHVEEEYLRVTENLDRLLASHGYVRNGFFYRAERANEDTLVFFCHFGVECVLLSHLLNISPMQLWHGTCALPSSVTTLYTEERRRGTAYFRMCSFGDLSHLYAAGQEPSFAARFCETYDRMDQRHD